MEMRLQKVLAQAGIASRRKAEELITEGRVEVNGAIERQLGTRVDAERDLIRVDGKLIESERKVYYLLYKPLETVTTLSDPQGRRTILDCMKGVEERVFAVGRLDYDAEGALIVTNDGELANRLMHPRYDVPRTYLAKVKGEPDEATLEKLRAGVTLEDGPARPDAVELEKRAEKNTWLRLVVSEGRPHLVKRMCAAIGHPVARLYRPSYAGLSVEGLSPGSYRPLTREEIEALRHSGKESERGAGAPLKLPPRRHRAAEESAASRPPKTRGGERKSSGFLSEGAPGEESAPARRREAPGRGEVSRERRGSGFREREPGSGKPRFGGAQGAGSGRAGGQRGFAGAGDRRRPFGERRFAGGEPGRPTGKRGFRGAERPPKRGFAGAVERGEAPFGKRAFAGEGGERAFGKRGFSAGERGKRPVGPRGGFAGGRGERPFGKRGLAGERSERPFGKRGFAGERGERPFGKRGFAGERSERPDAPRRGGFDSRGAGGAGPQRGFAKRGPGGMRPGGPGGGRPGGGRPGGGRPGGGRPGGGRPGGGRPGGGRPGGGRPGGGRPGGGRPGGARGPRRG